MSVSLVTPSRPDLENFSHSRECGGVLWVSVHIFLMTKEDAVGPGHSVSPVKCLFQSRGPFCNWGVCLLPELYRFMFWIQVLPCM